MSKAKNKFLNLLIQKGGKEKWAALFILHAELSDQKDMLKNITYKELSALETARVMKHVV